MLYIVVGIVRERIQKEARRLRVPYLAVAYNAYSSTSPAASIALAVRQREYERTYVLSTAWLGIISSYFKYSFISSSTSVFFPLHLIER